MTLSRRQLLISGAAVAVAGAPILRVLPARAARSAIDSSGLTQAAFTAQIGTVFRVQAPTGTVGVRTVGVRLDSVTPLPRPSPPAPPAKGEGFSLIFVGPATVPFPQDRYLLGHPQLGKIDFLLVPVERARKGHRYEAVVNRLW